MARALTPPPEDNKGEVRLHIGTAVRTGIHLITRIQGTGRADLAFSDRPERGPDGMFLRLT